MTADLTTLDDRRRRCLFRATHRGTKEMDWLLGRFAQVQLPASDAAALDLWESMVLLPDPQLYDWIVNGAEVDDAYFRDIVRMIRAANGLGN